MMRFVLVHSVCWVIGAMLVLQATAQTTGTCAEAEAEAYLDVNNVRARIFNNGALFWRGTPFVYHVPKEDSVSALFTSSIWIGGYVGGELRVAAARYHSWQFWPGPLDDLGNPPADCTPYDQIYEITRDDFITYAETGVPTDNLRDWPWHLGAPIIDGDGIDGNYDLDGGDRPALMGDQMLWWVMNDAGNEHKVSGSDTPPIGMEVHGSAFAFNRPNSFFSNVTFYRYVLHYKGPTPFEDAYFGVFSDPDLGNFDDDWVGSDSTLHLAYVYNSDDFDEGGDGYGQAPPATGYTILRSADAPPGDRLDNDRDGTADEPGEQRGLTSFMFYNGGGCVTCDPYRGQGYYYYMQARWRDGRPVTLGGNGRDFSNIPTRFMFSGNPVTRAYWTEMNADGQGTSIAPADRRFVAGSGPFEMQPGSTQEILFAIVWARGDDHLDSVRLLKNQTRRLHEVAERILVPNATVPSKTRREPDPVLGFAQNYPNPFRRSTTIRYSVPQPMYVRLTVYDVLGRTLLHLVDEHQTPGIYEVPFNADALPSGLYIYQITLDHLRFTRRMTLVR